ncbi:MAG: MFS transporter [Candidatus Limnocylindrales bacterium]
MTAQPEQSAETVQTSTDRPSPAPTGVRDVLRIPDFRRLWAAQAISDIGDGLTNLTLLLVVIRLTGSTAALAAMAIALAVPAIVVGPVAGVFVDRWERRRVMLASDLIRAAIVLGFAVVQSTDQLWLLYALAVAHATVGTFFFPARAALMPRVVPADGLMAANSLNQISRVIAGVLGASAAGILVGVADVTWPAFVADATTFLLSFLIVSRVVTRGRAENVGAARDGIVSSLRNGLGLVAGSRILVGTMVAAGVTMLGLGAVNVLFVPLMVRTLEVPATWLGIVDIAQTASMILAAGTVALLAARLRPTTIVVVGLAGIAVVISLVAGVTAVWQVALLMFAVGWFVTPLEASLLTIVQTGAGDSHRGRVISTLHAVMSAASVVSMALAGVFADLIGVRIAFLLAGMVVGIAAVTAAILFRGVSVETATRSTPVRATEAVPTASDTAEPRAA